MGRGVGVCRGLGGPGTVGVQGLGSRVRGSGRSQEFRELGRGLGYAGVGGAEDMVARLVVPGIMGAAGGLVQGCVQGWAGKRR